MASGGGGACGGGGEGHPSLWKEPKKIKKTLANPPCAGRTLPLPLPTARSHGRRSTLSALVVVVARCRPSLPPADASARPSSRLPGLPRSRVADRSAPTCHRNHRASLPLLPLSPTQPLLAGHPSPARHQKPPPLAIAGAEPAASC
uniref:Uncharacterized protein n=1 Tax=Oryza sativa subsp. japonica TaxID=39947 RepID=Q75L77_ORYSJ|nr:hypothetical protein [Oryza sativa Japonica Group]